MIVPQPLLSLRAGSPKRRLEPSADMQVVPGAHCAQSLRSSISPISSVSIRGRPALRPIPAQKRMMDDRGRVADPAQPAPDMRPDQALGGEQGHLRIVGDRTALPAIGRQCGEPGRKASADFRKRLEFNIGPQAVAHGTADEAGLEDLRGVGQTGGLPLQPLVLFGRLDGAGSDAPHLGHSCVRRPSALNHQQGGNRPRATQPAPAMDHDLAAIFELLVNPPRQPAPMSFAVSGRHIDISDLKVKPFHPACPQPFGQPADGERIELMVLDQRQHHVGAPGFDRIKIERQIPRPRLSEDAVALFSGAKRQADLAVGNRQAVDAQRMGDTGAGQGRLL